MHWINFLNKKEVIFQPRAQCYNALSSKDMMSIDGYGDEGERPRL